MMGMNFDPIVAKTILRAAKEQQVIINGYNYDNTPTIFGVDLSAQKTAELKNSFQKMDGIDGSAQDNNVNLNEGIYIADSTELKDDQNAKTIVSSMTEQVASKIDYDKFSRKNDTGKHNAMVEENKEFIEWADLSKKAQDAGYWSEEQSNKVKNLILSGKRDIDSSKVILAKYLLDHQKTGNVNPPEEQQASDKAQPSNAFSLTEQEKAIHSKKIPVLNDKDYLDNTKMNKQIGLISDKTRIQAKLNAINANKPISEAQLTAEIEAKRAAFAQLAEKNIELGNSILEQATELGIKVPIKKEDLEVFKKSNLSPEDLEKRQTIFNALMSAKAQIMVKMQNES